MKRALTILNLATTTYVGGIYYLLFILIIVSFSAFYFAIELLYSLVPIVLISFGQAVKKYSFWDEIIGPSLDKNGVPKLVLTSSASHGDPNLDGSDKRYYESNGVSYLLPPDPVVYPEKYNNLWSVSSESERKEIKYALLLEEQSRFVMALEMIYERDNSKASSFGTSEDVDNVVENYSKGSLVENLEYLSKIMKEGGNKNSKLASQKFYAMTTLINLEQHFVVFTKYFLLITTALYSGFALLYIVGQILDWIL